MALLHGLLATARQLLRSPGYAAVVVLTLGLGVGATAAVYSLVDGVLLEPMPYPEPERLVSVSEDDPGERISVGWASVPNYLDWRERAAAFEHLALFRGRSASVGAGAAVEYAYGVSVSPEFFGVFGVEPLLGRGFLPGEAGAEAAPVVILGHGLWERGFGGDPGVLGRTVAIDGAPHTVVGVMPRGFSAPGEWIGPSLAIGFWRPFPLGAPEGRDNRSYNVVGRLRAGTDLAAARQEMEALDAALAAEYPDANGEWRVQLVPWTDLVVGGFRPALLLLLGAVGLLLAVACANVASLSVTRVLRRTREMATRRALGAGRARILGQILGESLLLALAGGALGMVLARGGLALVRLLEPGRIPRMDQVALDGSAFLTGFAAAAASGAVLAALTAAATWRGDVAGRLRAASADPRLPARRLRTGLAALQVATSFALLAGAGLLATSLQRLTATDLGFQPAGVTTATVALSWERVGDRAARNAFVADVLAGLETLPGVEAAGMINSLPLSGSTQQLPATAEDAPAPGDEELVGLRGVSPSYFAAMSVPVLQGRAFTEDDLRDPVTVLVNRRLTDTFWPGRDPVGRALRLPGDGAPRTVVGVVGDVRHHGPADDVRPEVYTPYTVESLTSKTFVVRGPAASADPAALAAGIRDVVARVDPGQPIREVRSMEEWAEGATAEVRFEAALMAAGAGLATVLALVGLFAALTALVGERTREIAVRVALGARRPAVLALVVRQAALLVGAGLAGGVLLALGLGEALRSVLFGVDPRHPATLAAVALLFVVVALPAVVLPARRAASVDPARVLRED